MMFVGFRDIVVASIAQRRVIRQASLPRRMTAPWMGNFLTALMTHPRRGAWHTSCSVRQMMYMVQKFLSVEGLASIPTLAEFEQHMRTMGADVARRHAGVHIYILTGMFAPVVMQNSLPCNAGAQMLHAVMRLCSTCFSWMFLESSGIAFKKNTFNRWGFMQTSKSPTEQ